MIELQAVFYYVMKDRSVYDELRREVDQAVESGKISETPSYSEAIQLPFLKATIKEALRLHPGVGFTMPRIVDQNGIELAGMYIPPGWKVGMNAAVVGRDAGVYGSDADTFRPERWIDRNDPLMERCYNLAFGAGTRTCIGKQASLPRCYACSIMRPRGITNMATDCAERDIQDRATIDSQIRIFLS